jgi:hypothetical protein
MNKTTVYVLGAGCSANYCYPMAKDFVRSLAAYRDTLGDDSTNIRKCVDETVGLMLMRNVATLDDLAHRIEHGAYDEAGMSPIDKYALRDRRIRNAKIATEALFLKCEAEAQGKQLESYHNFIHRILPRPTGADNWQRRLVASSSRVLTFNYERLFEMAFLSRFSIDTGINPLYGQGVLNSGLSVMQNDLVDFAENRFCFLKLHGSIGGWRAEDYHGSVRFYHDFHGPLPGKLLDVNDEYFKDFFKTESGTLRPEMLIVFPHEKQDSLSSSGTKFYHRKYIEKVWGHAQQLIAEAGEIWVIGYSFAALDLADFVRMLSNAPNCEKIVIQNPDAESICRNLSMTHPNLAQQLKPHTSLF